MPMGLYVLFGAAVLLVAFLGYAHVLRYGSRTSALVGYSAFLGAVLFSSLYNVVGLAMYQAQGDLFAAMDLYMCRLIAILTVAWIVGVTIPDFLPGAATKSSHSGR